MAGKYSGAYIPGAGGDDPPAPKPSLHEKYGKLQELREERAENAARLAVWMNGREPVEWWEDWPNATPPQRFFCMEFPTTIHTFVVAWERAPELGKLYVWCFGCRNDSCGACVWIRKAYVASVHDGRDIGRAHEDDLPF